MWTKKETHRGKTIWLSSRKGDSASRSYFVNGVKCKHYFTFTNGNKESAEAALDRARAFIDKIPIYT